MKTLWITLLVLVCLTIVGFGIYGLAENAVYENYGGEDFRKATMGMCEVPGYLSGSEGDATSHKAATAILEHTKAYRLKVDQGLRNYDGLAIEDRGSRLKHWSEKRPSLGKRYDELLSFEDQLELAVKHNKVTSATLRGYKLQIEKLSFFDEFEVYNATLYLTAMICKWLLIAVGCVLLFILFIAGVAR